ncbi:hypothetical protein [Mucilaginibacter phyllosphaerae]
MNTETDYLKSIAEEIVQSGNKEIKNPNHHLLTEAKRLEKAIMHSLNSIENFTQRDTFCFNTLQKLVQISDILFDFTRSLDPNVKVLVELLTAIKQLMPSEIRPNLKLSRAFVEMQKTNLTAQWARYQTVLEQQAIDPRLIGIAGIPFKRFTERKHQLYWSDFTWLRGYQAKLDIMDWNEADCSGKTEALISLLIGRDFNDDRFYIYCKKYIQNRLKGITGKRNRLLEYAFCEKLVLEDTQVGIAAFDLRSNSVSARLLKWIKEEIVFVQTHELDRPQTKLVFKWNVEMIAFFFKLLHEKQAFGKIPLEPFAETIAANCSSVGKDDIQPATIHSRFYMKDLQVIKAIETLLVEMLEIVRIYLR